MDNQKTGALIRQLRTGRGMTQKDLARQLAVTDRAVSKWERGLCAPDIALLEPLAAALGCPIEALLRGEMVPPEAAVPDTVRILDWARAELARQAGRLHRRMLLGIGAALAGLTLLTGWLLWQSGTPWLLETIPLPGRYPHSPGLQQRTGGPGLRVEGRGFPDCKPGGWQ